MTIVFPRDATATEQLTYLLRYAILAPSGHNSQPWLFRVADDFVELYADRSRALPVVDPADRELTISCGAALFQLRLAMRHFGLRDAVNLLPAGSSADLLARVTVDGRHEPTEDEHRLFAAIYGRHTNRLPYEKTPVSSPQVAALINDVTAEGAWFVRVEDGEPKGAVADLIAEGDRIQASDQRFRRELAAWLHPNRSKSGDGIPGYAVGIGDLASYLGPMLVRTFDWGSGRAAKDRQLAEGSPLLLVIGTSADTPDAWIQTGQALARMLLRATSLGLSASFLNQPIEVPELRQRLSRVIEAAGFPQLLLRMGFGQPTRPTPRRPLDDVIIV